MNTQHTVVLCITIVALLYGMGGHAHGGHDHAECSDDASIEITRLSPTDDWYAFGSRENVLVATFNQPITLLAGGKISLTDVSDGSASTVISLPDDRVSVNRDVELQIDMGSNFELGTHYAVGISNNAIGGMGNTSQTFAGIDDQTTWDFSTVRELLSIMVVTIEVNGGKPNRTMKKALAELFGNNGNNVDMAFRVGSYGNIGLVLGNGSDQDPMVELRWPHLKPDDHRKKNFRHRAEEVLIKKGYNIKKDYRFTCFVLPREVSGPDGSASVGGYWGNFKIFWRNTINHELGHCLGAQHSQGDPGCVMGDVRSQNYNAAIKHHLGWLKPFPGTVSRVSADTKLTLVPLNKHPEAVPGMRVVNIPLPKGESLCISYRVHDQANFGGMKHGKKASKKVHVSYLPPKAKSRNHHKATLGAGETFAFKGVEIICDSVADDGLSANVQLRFSSSK